MKRLLCWLFNHKPHAFIAVWHGATFDRLMVCGRCGRHLLSEHRGPWLQEGPLWWLVLAMVLLGMSSCTPFGVHDIAMALNDRHIGHCLYVHGSIPPYGYATLLAQSGDLDCLKIWREWSQPPL